MMVICKLLRNIKNNCDSRKLCSCFLNRYKMCILYKQFSSKSQDSFVQRTKVSFLPLQFPQHLNICPQIYFRRTIQTLIGCQFIYRSEYEDPISEDQVVNIVYIDKSGSRIPVKGKVGDNVLFLAQRYGIEMEGACEGKLCCTTCHCYVPDEIYDKLPSLVEQEEDLLDMVPFLKPNSRLGCQIILEKYLEGSEIILPFATKNFYVDGHTPKPH